MTLETYIRDMSDADTVELAKKIFIKKGRELGADAVLCLPLPFGSSSAASKFKPVVQTFPASIRAFYETLGPTHDPFMEAALAYGAPVRFRLAAKDFTWTEKQIALFQKMREEGFEDGVASPVMAKPGSAAYCSFAFRQPRDDLGLADLRMMHIVFLEFFVRFRELNRHKRPSFSARERQILVGIITGRSAADMAERLGISRHTVDTYISRCFEKLEVNSRMEAALKCMGIGVNPADINVDDDAASVAKRS